MLVVDIFNFYFVVVMYGVEIVCCEYGYSLVVCNIDCDDEQECYYLVVLQFYNVEGLIVNIFGYYFGELCVLYCELLMVLVDCQLVELDIDLVGLDNVDVVEQVFDYLQYCGFCDILLVIELFDGISLWIEWVQVFNVFIGW